MHYECVFSEVHVCCCLKGASSTGSQQEKQIKSPWLRLLLWNHEDAAGVLFCKRCWLLIGWQWWSCMLKFRKLLKHDRDSGSNPLLLGQYFCLLSHSLFLFSPLIYGSHGLFLDFDCQELLNQIRRFSVFLCLSLIFSPLASCGYYDTSRLVFFQLRYWFKVSFLSFGVYLCHLYMIS